MQKQSSAFSGDPKPYHRQKILIFFLDLGITLSYFLIAQASGLSAFFKDSALSHAMIHPAQTALYMVFFFNGLYVLSLPLHFYSGFFLEKKFSLSTQNLAAWLVDESKRYALSFLFFVSVATAWYELLVRFPHSWWVWSSIGWLFLTLFLARILPTVLIPIFYPMKALPPGELKTRLLALCKRCGVKILDIYEIGLSKKTKKANAALVGIGKSRRIVIGDTLLDDFTTEEIEMVLCHEIGHHAKKHILKSFAVSGVITTIGFYLFFLLSEKWVVWMHAESLGDLALFPSIAFLSSLAAFLILPAQNGFSRSMENEADAYALRFYPLREVFTSLMNKLAVKNLADPNPHPWIEFLLYDHPSIRKRIAYAKTILDQTVP